MVPIMSARKWGLQTGFLDSDEIGRATGQSSFPAADGRVFGSESMRLGAFVAFSPNNTEDDNRPW
ncbi:hypothetical protein Pan216_41140 [Planctomycetes bacterium Pan216]|uniref:Uncharacterized protein n=1 Tax=Kolteria novifilia TaxID=2527975 RepID=A0A518B8D2_9BACT|nr:hypothetical protein Pan216_41140 [Planctomycetes bacterium Pan216]